MGFDQVLGGSESGVVELDAGDGALGFDFGGELCEAFDMVVGPAAELTREALALGLDVGSAGHGEGEATLGAHDEPVVLVLGNSSVRVALMVCHRREGDAVLPSRAVLESELIERGWHPYLYA